MARTLLVDRLPHQSAYHITFAFSSNHSSSYSNNCSSEGYDLCAAFNMMLILWDRRDLCMLDPIWLFVNLRLHHWVQRLCYLMRFVHLYTVVHFGVLCISTPIVNWILHIMMPLDSYCRNLYGAVHLNFLWPIMCLHLLLIFVNWCILCGDPWMPRTMFSLVLHYAQIFSLVHLFLEGGVTFSFNV